MMSPNTNPGCDKTVKTQLYNPQRKLDEVKNQFSSLSSDAESYEWNGEPDPDADSRISSERNTG